MSTSFSKLKKNLKKDFSGLPEIKVAVLADSASQFFCQALRGYGYTQNLNLNMWEADYDRIYEFVMEENSELYSFQPKYIIIFQSPRKLLYKFNKSVTTEKRAFADAHKLQVEELVTTINLRLKCNIIYLNFPEINDSVFGNFGNKTENAFIYQLRKINFELMQLAIHIPNLNIADISVLQNLYGAQFLMNDRFYISVDNIYNIDSLGYIAASITSIILAFSGIFRKCVILDLDNTLWGGIIGDDGMENIQIGNLGIGKAFTEFQLWVKQLKERGIILAVCSKNTEDIAKEPFEKHPDMVLHLEDIAVFVANWENKVDNIRYIQTVLNIGFDSMIFLDDNPAEREIVKTNLPDILVPELPEDPAEYLSFLYTQHLFETISFTKEDILRNKQYQDEAKRNILQHSFVNEAEYLKNLEMQAVIKAVDNFSLPRAAQLTQRSNQFNLRTVRYTEDDLKKISTDPEKYTLTISLKDKFGDYGLISLIIADKKTETELFIDTWIMSCRVLKREVENFTLNELVNIAKKNGFMTIVGEYIPTPKNALVKDHYKKLGFKYNDNYWHLNMADYFEKNNAIQKCNL